jgi:hypothetical protein
VLEGFCSKHEVLTLSPRIIKETKKLVLALLSYAHNKEYVFLAV